MARLDLCIVLTLCLMAAAGFALIAAEAVEFCAWVLG